MKLSQLQEILARFPGEGVELSQVRHCIYVTKGTAILAVIDVETGVLTETPTPPVKKPTDNKFQVRDL